MRELHDPIKKRNSKFKRTQYLMKKVKELATLCNLMANFSYYDPSINKVVEFASHEEASVEGFMAMLHQEKSLLQVESGRKLTFKHKIIYARDLAQVDDSDAQSFLQTYTENISDKQVVRNET